MPIAAESVEPLARRLQDQLATSVDGAVQVTSLVPLPGGACQENFRVEVELDGVAKVWVLRSDARASLPGSLPRRTEYAVIRLAASHGVPTPPARFLLPDLVRPGADAVVMDWCDGIALGAKVVRDPRLAEARERLPGQLAAALAAIHRVGPEHAPDLVLDVPQSATDTAGAVDAALRFNRVMCDALPDAHPAMELAQRWLHEHAPEPRPRVLVHGDFRTGNFLVGPDGLQGVLDWEFAHWGSPAADLGWIAVRDWRFGALDRPVGGLCDRSTFVTAYEAAGGRPTDPAEVHWWEVCGNLRWAAGACYQAERVLQGHEGDLELLAIGRRACEMEYEALRLIDVGPHA